MNSTNERGKTLDRRVGCVSLSYLYQDNSWQDFLAALRPVVDGALARYHEIASAGPAEDQDILQSMIEHEKSFVHWIEKETAGEEGSLDSAIGQLQYPLPPFRST